MTNYSISKNYLKESKIFDKKLLKIEVVECYEELVDLKKYLSGLGVLYSKQPERFYFLRSSVALALKKSIQEMNKEGYIVKIEHAYRPLSLQKKMFKNRLKEVANLNKGISRKDQYSLANMYTAGIPILAAHTSGGAVDLTLADLNYQEIDMGSEYSALDDVSITNFPKLPDKIKTIRKLFCEITAKNGLVNYPYEYWHFSRGDVCASFINKESHAIYSPVEFDRKKASFDVKTNIDLYDYFTYR